MSQIIINGASYIGSSISINNNNIQINGETIQLNDKQINIEINGNIDDLKVDYCQNFKITGDVNSIQSGSGDINVSGSINGNVQTGSGDVECEGSIAGNVNTGSGDVKCNNVGGSVKTMSGDIKYKKHE